MEPSQIIQLETQYLKAKIAYYDGDPVMSDAAFDALEQELKNAGSKVVEQVAQSARTSISRTPRR